MNKPRFWKRKYEKAVNSFKFTQGIRELEDAAGQSPMLNNNDEFLTKLALLYDHEASRHSGRTRERFEARARGLCERALKANPKSYRAVWGIGRILWHRKDVRALKFARKAYHLRRRVTGTVGMYGQHVALIYEIMKKYKLAERWYLRGTLENPREFGVYLNLTLFYLARGDAVKAKHVAKNLDRRFQRKSPGFKKTAWGKRIANVIAEAEGTGSQLIDPKVKAN